MPEKVLNRETLAAHIARFERIESDAQRQWGELSATEMMVHIATFAEVSLEKRAVEDISTPVVSTIFYWLFMRWFTKWPPGKIKAPAKVDYLFPKPEEDLDSVRAQLIGTMREFVDALDADPERKVLSPLLGRISLRKWSYVHGAHNDHHLRQFGV